MRSAHRSPDARSALVLDTHDLGRRAGAMKLVRTTSPAPADLGTPVIGVAPGSPIELDVRLESVVEGVLVTGHAVVDLVGECVRCLEEVTSEMEIDIQELFVYPGSETTEDEASRLDGDLADLEPLLRDAVVLDLPFQPLCRPDCRGLCAVCGQNLNARPDHSHEQPVDPRWAGLAGLGRRPDDAYDVTN